MLHGLKKAFFIGEKGGGGWVGGVVGIGEKHGKGIIQPVGMLLLVLAQYLSSVSESS